MVNRLSYAAAGAALNAINALFNVGTGNALLRMYSGARPASVETAVSTQVLLAEFILPNPLFPAATGVLSTAQANAAAIAAVNGLANGTATWFRVLDRNGLAVMDGDITEYPGTGALQVPTAAVASGKPVIINGWQSVFPL
jgi:hypothetical protein